MPAEPRKSGSKSSRRELALCSNVEQSRAQSERNGQTGERESRCLVKNLSESVGIAPRSLEQQPVNRRGRLAVAQNQKVAADKRDE